MLTALMYHTRTIFLSYFINLTSNIEFKHLQQNKLTNKNYTVILSPMLLPKENLRPRKSTTDAGDDV